MKGLNLTSCEEFEAAKNVLGELFGRALRLTNKGFKKEQEFPKGS
jgi:hypothetical protein